MTDLPPPLPLSEPTRDMQVLPTAEGFAVDAGIIPVWRWHALGSALLVLLITAVGAILLAVNFPHFKATAATGFLLMTIAELVYCIFYPGAYYRHLRYWIDADGIRIQHGVFWRSLSYLPRVRIQHSDVSQGPLQRRRGVATLKLYTAGSQFTKIELDGLKYETAVTLRDQLQSHDSGDAV